MIINPCSQEQGFFLALFGHFFRFQNLRLAAKFFRSNEVDTSSEDGFPLSAVSFFSSFLLTKRMPLQAGLEERVLLSRRLFLQKCENGAATKFLYTFENIGARFARALKNPPLKRINFRFC